MALPNAGDVQKTVDRVADYHYVSVALPGTWTASDYLGDTSGDNGTPMPNATLTEIYVQSQTTPSGSSSTDLLVENEDSGNNYFVSGITSQYTEDTDANLYFSEGDQLSVAFDSVDDAEAGSDGTALLRFEVDSAPMN